MTTFVENGVANPDRMLFLMIVNDPQIARYAYQSGVGCLFVDLEFIGKETRQKGLDTWKSRHTIEDVTAVREAVEAAHLLVRINPLHDGTAQEIEEVLARGADSIMLPMFQSAEEVAKCLDIIRARADLVPLVETRQALANVPHIAETLPLARLHFGLNDLHLNLGLDFMFEPLADGLLEAAAEALRASCIAFGIGGVARAGEGHVSPEYLLGEHVRLGSDAAILSRTLHRNAKDLATLKMEMDLPRELAKLQAIYERFCDADQETLEENRGQTIERIREVAQAIKGKRSQ